MTSPSQPLYLGLALISLLLAILCILYLRPLSYWRCSVVNTESAELISRRGDSPRQDAAMPGLIRFRKQLAPLLDAKLTTVDQIAVLRHWVRSQQSDDRQLWFFPRDADSGDVDPGILLAQQRGLQPGACRRFGYVLAGALLSAGIPARLVVLQASFTDGLGHVMVEAWTRELNKWILVDPTADSMYLVDGRYASLLELRKALLARKPDSIRFERNGSRLNPPPRLDYLTRIAKHAFVFTNERLFTDPPLTKASVWRFQLLHYVDRDAEPYPESARELSILGAIVFGACAMLLLGRSAILAVRKPAEIQRHSIVASASPATISPATPGARDLNQQWIYAEKNLSLY